MKVQSTPRPTLANASRIRVGELTQVGATLTEEEMKAVAGARRMEGSWSCGSPARTDEWTVPKN
jgi:hypothetical protein